MEHKGTRAEVIEKVVLVDGPPVYTVELTEDEAHIIVALLGGMRLGESDTDTDPYEMYVQFLELTGATGRTQRYTSRRDGHGFTKLVRR